MTATDLSQYSNDDLMAMLQNHPDANPSFWQRLNNDWDNRVDTEIKPTLSRLGSQGLLDDEVQFVGTGAGGISDIAKEAYNSLPDSFTGPTNASIQNFTRPICDAAQSTSNAVDNTSIGQKIGDSLMNMPAPLAADLHAIGNIWSAAPIAEGAGNFIANTTSGIKSGAVAATRPIARAMAPFTEAGRNKIAAQNLASSAADPQAAAAALKNAPEYIPQSYPTTGPASGDTGLLSLERTLWGGAANHWR